MNSYKRLKGLYSKRHDKIVEVVYQKLRQCNQASNLFCNRMAETPFRYLRTELQQMNNRKPDIIVIRSNNKICEIIEVTAYFDSYMSEPYRSKCLKYYETEKHTSSKWDNNKHKNIVFWVTWNGP